MLGRQSSRLTMPLNPPALAPDLQLGIADTPALQAQILDLQQRNLFSRLSAEAQSRDGFVFVEHTAAQLAAMAARMPQSIVLCEGRVVGYSLCMSPDMRAEIPRLVPMFEQFDRMLFRGRRLADWDYVVGGQVCVDAAWRGRGLIGALYQNTRRCVPEAVEVCVTEIAARNEVSLRAHYRIGFEAVERYRDDAEHWEVVAWRWREGD
jgi:GNAT superfamily N-acetyltransferase